MAKTDALKDICPVLVKDFDFEAMMVQIIDLLNDLKAKYNSAVTLINELKADHNAHCAATGLHYDGAASVTDTTNTVSSSDASITAKSDVDNS